MDADTYTLKYSCSPPLRPGSLSSGRLLPGIHRYCLPLDDAKKGAQELKSRGLQPLIERESDGAAISEQEEV